MAFKLTDKQKVSLAIVITFSFFVLAFKTRSLALMADAFHYLNDFVGFGVTLTSIIISSRTEFRQDLSFGWQRARLLGAFFNGSFLLALGISILLQSIERLVSIEHVEEPKLVFILGCVGFGLNVITAAFLHEHHHHHSSKDTEQGLEAGDNTESPASVTDDLHHQHRHVGLAIKRPGRDLGMLGALLHVVGDALNNLGVIVAALVIWLSPSSDRYYADPAIGLVISLMILFSAYPLVKQSGTILLQSAPEGVNLTDIRHDIEKIPGIHSVHELHVWRLDQKKAIASAHIIVSNPDVASFMEQAKTISQCLHAYGIHSTTLQPELIQSLDTITVSDPASVTDTTVVPDGDAIIEEDSRGGTKIAGHNPPTCQIVCGKGLCNHLTCCNRPKE